MIIANKGADIKGDIPSVSYAAGSLCSAITISFPAASQSYAIDKWLAKPRGYGNPSFNELTSSNKFGLISSLRRF